MCVLYARAEHRYNADEKGADPMDFKDKSYDVFHMFNDRWALATVGTIDEYNTMTIA